MPPSSVNPRDPVTGIGGAAAFVDGATLGGVDLIEAVRDGLLTLPDGAIVAVAAASDGACTALVQACRSPGGLAAEPIASFDTDRGTVVMLRRLATGERVSDADRPPASS